MRLAASVQTPKIYNVVLAPSLRSSNVSTDLAASEYADATDSVRGETSVPSGSDFTVNRQGLLNVINLRPKFGGLGNNIIHFDFRTPLCPALASL